MEDKVTPYQEMDSYDQREYDLNMKTYHEERADFFKKRLQLNQSKLDQIRMNKHKKKADNKLSKL